MLAKKHRIDRKLFKEIIKKGKSFSGRYLSFKILPLFEEYSRFSFIVPSRSIKRAVDRNKIKRRARNIVQEKITKFKKGIGVIIFFRKGSEKLTFLEIEKEINDIFNF